MASSDSTNNRMDAPSPAGADNGHAVSLSQEANSLHAPLSTTNSGGIGGNGGDGGVGHGAGEVGGGAGSGYSSSSIEAHSPAAAKGGQFTAAHSSEQYSSNATPGDYPAGGAGGQGAAGDAGSSGAWENAGGSPYAGYGNSQNYDGALSHGMSAESTTGSDRGQFAPAHAADALYSSADSTSGASYDNSAQSGLSGGKPGDNISQKDVDEIHAGFAKTADLYATSGSGMGKGSSDSQGFSKGSESGAEGGVDAPASNSSGDAHRDRAREIISGASNAERTVTPDMQSLAQAHGGEMVGLDHRLKSEDSLTRKLTDENRTDVGDALRYTMSMPNDKLADGSNQVMQKMEQNGYQKESVRNTFPADVPYKGVNTTFSKDGQKFELQFHTAESLAAKEQTHGPYEVRRELTQKNADGSESFKSPAQLGEVADKYAHYLAPHPELAAHGAALSEAGKNNSPEAAAIADQLSLAIFKKGKEISSTITMPDNINSVKNFSRGEN